MCKCSNPAGIVEDKTHLINGDKQTQKQMLTPLELIGKLMLFQLMSIMIGLKHITTLILQLLATAGKKETMIASLPAEKSFLKLKLMLFVSLSYVIFLYFK